MVSLKLESNGFAQCLLMLHLFRPVFSQFVPEEIIINSGRPTFYDRGSSVPGKIALEEHVAAELFSGTFPTPFVNSTKVVNFATQAYMQGVLPRLTNIDSRVLAMDSANTL